LLSPYRENGDILEIGIWDGSSARMWREYFRNGIVAAVDIEIKPAASHLQFDDSYKIFVEDASSTNFLTKLGSMKFDIIIDDGSHWINHQITSFNLLKEYVKPGGLYIIEDIQDINAQRDVFNSLYKNCEIYDNRHILGRWDDVLVIYKF
jgi:hypothetical protein